MTTWLLMKKANMLNYGALRRSIMKSDLRLHKQSQRLFQGFDEIQLLCMGNGRQIQFWAVLATCS